MKKLLKYIFILVVVVLIGGSFYLYPRLPIINGYAAKMVCSCTFIANRPLDSIQAQELDFFPINLANSSVDKKTQSASASFLGFQKQTAYYNPQTGCALIKEEKDAQEYQNHSFQTHNFYKQSDSLYWPYSTFINTQIPNNVDVSKLKDAVNKHFIETDTEKKEGVRRNTRAVLVIYKDQIIAEQYAPGFDANTRLLGWSMTKSVLNAMIGILVKQGKVNVLDPVPIKEWQKDDRKKITWNDLLQMSDGLDWEEDYASISNVTKMLYLEKDMYSYAIQTPLGSKPGTFFKYSSGTSNVLSGLVKQYTKDNYLAFPYDELFSKIGANSFIIETDPSLNYVASSYGWATARDWAKFGLLYLHDGNWNGEQILPKGWAKYSGTTVKTSIGYKGGTYGAHFWTQNEVREPDAPKDMYMAEGFQEQRVFILPSHDLVIVRLGLTMGGLTDFNVLVTDVLETINQ